MFVGVSKLQVAILLVRLGRCLKLFVSTESTFCHEFASQLGLELFYTKKNPKTTANTEPPARYLFE